MIDDWEVCQTSGQQRLDVPGMTYWLSDDKGWTIIKVTTDYAGVNASKPKWFPTEERAKNWINSQIRK